MTGSNGSHESNHLTISTPYIQPEDAVRRGAGMADGTFAGGGSLPHDALVTEQMPAESGRRLCLDRWGFVADHTLEVSYDVGKGVLFVQSTRCGTLVIGPSGHSVDTIGCFTLLNVEKPGVCIEE